MKILIGVDGTEKSLAALTFALRMTAAGRDELVLFFAPPQLRWVSTFVVSRETQEAMLAAFSQSVLAQARAAVPAELSSSTLLADERESKISRALLQAAEKSACDLVVVGAGRSSPRLHFSLGGVAHAVVHQSRRPVLACRATDAPTSGPLEVLLAVGPQETIAPMAHILHQLAWPPGSRGRMIHVMDYVEDERLRHWINELPDVDSTPWNAAMDQAVQKQREQLRDQLIEQQRELPDIFQAEEPVLVVGHVVEEIVDFVAAEKIDLVVVGGRPRGPVSRLLGSTTEGLLLQANASILVTHDQP